MLDELKGCVARSSYAARRQGACVRHRHCLAATKLFFVNNTTLHGYNEQQELCSYPRSLFCSPIRPVIRRKYRSRKQFIMAGKNIPDGRSG